MEEPSADTFPCDGFCHSFVECGVATSVIRLVGEFVENQLGEIHLVAFDVGIEERIVEVSQGGVSIYFTDPCFISCSFESSGFLFCALGTEEATVILVSDDGIPPAFGFEREWGGGVNEPDNVVAPKICVVAERAIDGHAEI